MFHFPALNYQAAYIIFLWHNSGGIVSNTLRPLVPESCDPEWRLLMERCWSSEPSERPSFTEIANELRSMAAKIPHKGLNQQQQPTSLQPQVQKWYQRNCLYQSSSFLCQAALCKSLWVRLESIRDYSRLLRESSFSFISYVVILYISSLFSQWLL